MNERQAHQAMDEAAEWAHKNREAIRRVSAEVIQMHRPHELERHFAPGTIDGPYTAPIERPRIGRFFALIPWFALGMILVGVYAEIGDDLWALLMPWK